MSIVNDKPTPETDAFFAEWTFTSGVLARSRLHAEKLERERDEAMDALEYIAHAGLSARHIEDYAKEFLSKIK
jgi:hypothetical protein